MASILRVLAALFLLALPAGAASAAPAESTIEPQLGTLTIAPGSPEKLTILWLRITATPSVEHHFSLKLDFSDVASFATVEVYLNGTDSVGAGEAPVVPSGPCARTPTSFTCEWDETIYTSQTLSYIALLSAEPKATAVTGDSGEIVTSAQIDGGTPSTSRSTVRVGEAVDIAAGGAQEVSATAGSTASTTPVVRNTGNAPIDRSVMFVEASPELLGKSSYRNCRYGKGALVCTFDTALNAGSSYAVSSPIKLTPPADSIPGSQAQAVVSWMTATEWEDLADVLPAGYLTETGTDDPLDLEETAASQSTPQSDVQADNDTGVVTLTVTGSGAPDMAAIGTKVTGARSGVIIRVGTANAGPGTLRPDLYPNNRVTALVTLPGNVKAAQVDPRCAAAGTGKYLCDTSTTLEPGDQEYFGFVLNLKKSHGTAGQIEVGDVLPSITGVQAAAEANNVAEITVTGTGGSGGGSGLPVTGSDAIDTAVLGFGLVILGTLLTVRRSQEFVYQQAGGESGRGRRRREPRHDIPGKHRVGDSRGGRRRAGHQRAPGGRQH
jgi:hypothetical protein